MKKTVIVGGTDGYIGNVLVQRLLDEGHTVVGLDNFLRRSWVEEDMLSFSAVPIMSMDEKLNSEEFRNFHFYEMDVADQPHELEELIKTYKPDAIVNLAHIPSGPFSQISQEKANFTLNNNIIGTSNFLWSIKQFCPNCHYITIGTTGEYDHYSNIDIEEGYVKFELKGRQSKEMMYPRRPGSIYHVSKTASTYLIDFLARTWGIKCTDVQQSIVFGLYTDESDKSKIFSRFDSDEAAGTVLNRFIIQAILDKPLTIYGEGKHQRGFLSLNDSVQALMIAVNNEAKPGHVQVWNQLSEWHSMNDVADMVVKVCGKNGIKVRTDHIPSPRTEFTGDHYYKYITKNLTDLGYVPTRTIEEEIEYVLSILMPFKDDLGALGNVVMPKIKWNN